MGMPVYELKPRKGSRVRLDREFYGSVADAYRSAVARGFDPRVELAEQAEVPRETIARWTHGARREGVLAAGKQGKVTV